MKTTFKKIYPTKKNNVVKFSRLKQGMFGSEFRQTGRLFGLRCGQMVSNHRKKEGHNYGWYNQKGEKLGWGDLSADNLMTIASELLEGEVFVTMGEGDSFWEFVDEPLAIINEEKIQDPNLKNLEEKPGVEYLIHRARHIIIPKKVYQVNDWEAQETDGPITKDSGLVYEYITRDAAEKIIRA